MYVLHIRGVMYAAKGNHFATDENRRQKTKPCVASRRISPHGVLTEEAHVNGNDRFRFIHFTKACTTIYCDSHSIPVRCDKAIAIHSSVRFELFGVRFDNWRDVGYLESCPRVG
jgi:hypothetical protein